MLYNSSFEYCSKEREPLLVEAVSKAQQMLVGENFYGILVTTPVYIFLWYLRVNTCLSSRSTSSCTATPTMLTDPHKPCRTPRSP